MIDFMKQAIVFEKGILVHAFIDHHSNHLQTSIGKVHVLQPTPPKRHSRAAAAALSYKLASQIHSSALPSIPVTTTP